MKRFLLSDLNHWKNDQNRKVLLLRGARQVGKTYLVRELGRSFEYFLEVNFEETPQIKTFFQDTRDPFEINKRLAAYFSIPIEKDKTLLFFDEIQSCPEALQALRFYHEKFPELHVAAAGSLLEFALAELPSFAVGRITSLFLYPMSFFEFLEAQGKEGLTQLIRESDFKNPLDATIHQKILEDLRIYQIVGGLPDVVKNFIDKNDISSCQSLLDGLVTSYRDDFAKYKKRAPVAKLVECFAAISHQAGQKFKYTRVADGESVYGYREALSLLVKAGLAYQVFHTAANGIPLGAQTDHKKFKVIPFDLGIHQRLMGLNLSEHLIKGPVDLVNKGNLAEIFVGLELVAGMSGHSHPQLYYWHRESRASNAEVDYVIQDQERIIPLEVKAGTRGQMQSLHLFLQEKKLAFGVRLSHENFAAFDKLGIYPIYAVQNLIS